MLHCSDTQGRSFPSSEVRQGRSMLPAKLLLFLGAPVAGAAAPLLRCTLSTRLWWGLLPQSATALGDTGYDFKLMVR